MIEIKKLEMEETEEKDQETTKNVEIILQGPDAEEFSGVLFALLEKDKPRDVIVADGAILCGRCGSRIAGFELLNMVKDFMHYCPNCGQQAKYPNYNLAEAVPQQRGPM